MKKSFFYHVAIETALRYGWDLEQDLDEFLGGLPKVILNEPVWQVNTLIAHERDVIEASKGVVTEKLYEMFKEFLKGVKPEAFLISPSPVVLASMHSGSSDYLYLHDVKELVEQYEKGVTK